MHHEQRIPAAGSVLTDIVTCPALSMLPHIRHGFFTRNGGVSGGVYASLNCGYGSGDNAEKIAQNRAHVAAMLGVDPGSLCTAYQIHSAKALVLDAPWPWNKASEVDALVTATPGLAIGVLTADCLPILLADDKNRVIAAAHAGWKGAIGGIIEATLTAMEGLGASPGHITATIGPSIAQGSYEVGSDFRDTFLKDNEANAMYFIHGARGGHYLFDLASYAKERLKDAGVADINVLAHDTCSGENDFFSYRRACLRAEGVYGRQISAIVINPAGRVDGSAGSGK